jgi:hypothetical protein
VKHDLNNENEKTKISKDYKMVLRIPRSLLNKIDEERKKHVSKISRTTIILELLDQILKEQNG